MTAKTPCPIEVAQAKAILADWAYENQATIVDALNYCVNDMPNSYISKYERALDALNAVMYDFMIKRKANPKGKQ